MISYSDFEDQWNRKQTVIKCNKQLQRHIENIRESYNKVRPVLREKPCGHRKPLSLCERIQSATNRFERSQEKEKTDWIHDEIIRWFSVRRIQRMFRN